MNALSAIGYRLSAIGYRVPGQTLIFLALVLPVLLAFVLLVIEAAERQLEVALVEDALQQATRSAVQQLDYAALAAGAEGIRVSADCTDVTLATAGDCAGLIAVADQLLRTNLRGVRGLGEPADALAARVRWTVRPQGGTCSFSGGAARSEVTPLLCAEVRPLMTGVVGWGQFTPLITAADTLDTTK